MKKAKGGRPARLATAPHTQQAALPRVLGGAVEPCAYLFRGRPGQGATPLAEGTISHLFQRHAKAAAIPPELRHPHALRHSCARHLARAGWDSADVKWWLGHKDIDATKIRTNRLEQNGRLQ